VEEAFRRPGVTGQYLLQMLERRLDNLLFRLGMVESRRQARQFILHGHILVNGRKVDVPSYLVKANDVIGWRATTKESEFFKAMAQDAPKRNVPPWLAFDTQDMSGRVVRLPEEGDLESSFDTRLIVEYYSR
jgi:small subunit ribosomal protein S4